MRRRFTRRELEVARDYVRDFEQRCEVLRDDMVAGLQAELSNYDDAYVEALWDEVV